MNNKLTNLLHLLLQESRKVYKDAPRISVFKELEPYKDKDDYYISFTSIEKIGVNPQSTFRTPLGIYAYPLKQSWEKYNVGENKKVGRSMPYAGSSQYVWLVKKKKGIKFVNSAEDYTEADLEADKERLTEYVLKNKERYYKSFFVDYPYYLKEHMVENYFNIWGRRANKKLPISKLWNITRNLAFRGRDINDIEGNTRTSIITNWNTLFYKVLGYYGFADKTGVGYIHEHEPIQAVFFTKTAFDVVKFSQNKERDFNSKEEMANKNWFYRNVDDQIETSNAVVEPMGTSRIKWKNGTWHDGTWGNGIWINGTWEDGEWQRGNWYGGIWRGGTWRGGNWYNGTWKGGNFNKGTWKNGVWEDGTWNGGVWLNGTFKWGIWNGGTWKNGTMEGVSWNNGIWKDGVWVDGDWKNGTWEGGTWKNGLWVKGRIYDPGKKGNYEKDWEWDYDAYVNSPISPKKYWAGKENLKPKIEKTKRR